MTPNPQVNDGTVTCNLGRLTANESVLIHVDVHADTEQTVNDTATVTTESADSDSTDNEAEAAWCLVATPTFRSPRPTRPILS